MAIKGATFDLQTVMAKYDGAMYEALSDGLDSYIRYTGAYPIAITSTNVITLSNGYMLIKGRIVVIDGATAIPINPGSSISSGYGRLVLQIDTTKTNTQSELNQVEILEEYASTLSGFRELQTDEINITGGVYEVQLCRFTVSNGTASSLVINIPTTGSKIEEISDQIDELITTQNALIDDVGDLTALGLSVPIPIAKGGTGETTVPNTRHALGAFIGYGHLIPDNSDINDYFTTGIYRIATATSAATMSNLPEAVSGKLIVSTIASGSEPTNQQYISQLYMPNGRNYFWYRTKTTTIGSWTLLGTAYNTYTFNDTRALTGLTARSIKLSKQDSFGYNFSSLNSTSDRINLPAGTYEFIIQCYGVVLTNGSYNYTKVSVMQGDQTEFITASVDPNITIVSSSTHTVTGNGSCIKTFASSDTVKVVYMSSNNWSDGVPWGKLTIRKIS